MPTPNRWVAAAATLAFAGLASTAAAQTAPTPTNTSINAVAYVYNFAPITCGTGTNLTFGSPGSPIGAGATSSTNGRFNCTGQPGAGVNISFTLPTVLTGTLGGTIPIAFGATDGLECATTDPTCASPVNTFDPHVVAYPYTLDGTTGAMYIGIGGTVTVGASTVTDDYSGLITLTVSY